MKNNKWIYDSAAEIYRADCKVNTVTVIVCIHNALDDVKECLHSLVDKRSFPYTLVLIDDGSDNETYEYLNAFKNETPCTLFRNEESKGYTCSANIGLKCALDTSEYIVLLNSDTIVTDRWVEKMLEVFNTHPDAGLVGPLSNAATYQSVPQTHTKGQTGWALNHLPDDIPVDLMAAIIEKTGMHLYPEIPILNGFCMMIKREVLNTIGFLDEASFPRGYGEEVDFCLRASSAGYKLYVADDTYIYHEKSKSFTNTVRNELNERSKPVLSEKHGSHYAEAVKELQDRNKAQLDRIRKTVQSNCDIYFDKFRVLKDKQIGFLLPAKGGSGGANSVCQEVMGLRELGLNVRVINVENNQVPFEQNYPELVPYTDYFSKKIPSSLPGKCKNYDMVIGTIFTSINYMVKLSEQYPLMKFGYYIQDYEPYFFSPDEAYYQEAKESYTKIKDCVLFAKTKWICDEVRKYHDVEMHLVEPSVDTLYYNAFVLTEKKLNNSITRISAMVRPQTLRRNPKGTMDVLQIVKNRLGDMVEIHLFGCDDDQLKEVGEYSFSYVNHGVLKRWEVAELLAASDIFLDMSTYQAFGRTGVECMCLGCVPVMPVVGGVDKFAVHNENALLVDTRDSEEVAAGILELINNKEQFELMRRNGIETGKAFNITNAVWSEALLFMDVFKEDKTEEQAVRSVDAADIKKKAGFLNGLYGILMNWSPSAVFNRIKRLFLRKQTEFRLISNTHHNIERMDSKVDRLLKYIEKNEKREQAINDAVSKLNKRINGITTQLDNEIQLINELSETIDTLKKDIEKLKNDVENGS